MGNDGKEECMAREAGSGAEGGRRPTGAPVPDADTEVVVPGKRKRFTKAYKLSVLDTVAELKKDAPGKLGEYLRSEGLYFSTVSRWRNDQRDGILSEHRKGTVGYVRESMAKENAKLKRELAATQKKLEQAELLVDLQKKVSQLILNESKIKHSDGGCEN
jgi:transposase